MSVPFNRYPIKINVYFVYNVVALGLVKYGGCNCG